MGKAEGYYTTTELARELKITRQGVLWAIKRGLLKGRRLPGGKDRASLWIIDADSVEQYRGKRIGRFKKLLDRLNLKSHQAT